MLIFITYFNVLLTFTHVIVVCASNMIASKKMCWETLLQTVAQNCAIDVKIFRPLTLTADIFSRCGKFLERMAARDAFPK